MQSKWVFVHSACISFAFVRNATNYELGDLHYIVSFTKCSNSSPSFGISPLPIFSFGHPYLQLTSRRQNIPFTYLETACRSVQHKSTNSYSFQEAHNKNGDHGVGELKLQFYYFKHAHIHFQPPKSLKSV